MVVTTLVMIIFSVVAVTAKKRKNQHGCSSALPQKNVKRRRWSDNERGVLLSAFGDDITKKSMPSAKQITVVSRSLPQRTIPQIRAQLSNYMCGKIRLD